jgi:hypothetical protein
VIERAPGWRSIPRQREEGSDTQSEQILRQITTTGQYSLEAGYFHE